MNKKELIQNLITDIQDIYTIANRFDNPEHIHSIDIDLALSKVRNLYELLLKLNPKETYLPEYQEKEISKIPEQVEQENETKPHKEPVKEEQRNPIIKEEVKEEIQKEDEFILEDPPAEKEEEKIEATEHAEKVKTEPEINSNGINHEIVADKFQSKKFVHDNISKKNIKKDVSSKMQSKPIKDINTAIGLNDKFIFIRELFDNNKDQYLETIQVLNNFDNYENALDFLNENFNWDSEDKNYERLKELVRRKYS